MLNNHNYFKTKKDHRDVCADNQGRGTFTCLTVMKKWRKEKHSTRSCCLLKVEKCRGSQKNPFVRDCALMFPHPSMRLPKVGAVN